LRLIHAPGLVPTYEELRANFRILTLWRWTTGAGALALAGFGALMPGTEFAPWPLVAGVAHYALQRAGLVGATSLRPAGVALPTARRCWNLASLLTIFHFTRRCRKPVHHYFVIHLFGTALSSRPRLPGVCWRSTATALMTLVARLEYSGRIPHVDVWGATGYIKISGSRSPRYWRSC